MTTKTNLRNRIEKLSVRVENSRVDTPALELMSEAINSWRAGRGLAPVEVSSSNLASLLRLLSYDRLISLYHNSLNLGSVDSARYKRLREMLPDEIATLYREAMA
jgi:hypothetical protein